MALGTNQLRNSDREQKAVDCRLERCRVLAQELVTQTGCSAFMGFHLAATVGLGRMTRDEAFETGWKALPQGEPN